MSLIRADDAEHRRKRGEVIVCDFRACGGNHGKQRGFADVGKSDKADVRQHFKLQNDLTFLAVKSVFCEARRLSCRRCEMTVSPAAAAALSGDKRLASAHILDDFSRFGVPDDGSVRNGNDEVGRRGAVEFRRHSVAAVFCNKFFSVAEIEQRVGSLVDGKYDIAAVSAVAAVRSSV